MDDETTVDTETAIPAGDVQFSLELDVAGRPTGQLIGCNVGRGPLYGPAGAFTLSGFDDVADTHRVGLSIADILITFV